MARHSLCLAFPSGQIQPLLNTCHAMGEAFAEHLNSGTKISILRPSLVGHMLHRLGVNSGQEKL